jgi:hypothetical protein
MYGMEKMCVFMGDTARALRKILPENAEIVYDKGGATLVKLRNHVLNYFFIGKNTTKYTGEYYYITISVHETNNKFEKDSARIIIRRGFLGIRKSIRVIGEGYLGKIIASIIYNLSRELYNSGYDELVVKITDRLVLMGKTISSGAGSSIVVIGRTSIFYTLTPYNKLKRMFLINKLIIEKLMSKLYQL